MLRRNQDKSIKTGAAKSHIKTRRLLIVLSVFSLAGGLVSCGEGNVKFTDAPSRNNTEFSKFASTKAIIKTVAPETYRVCDAAGCSNSITRKTVLSGINYKRKKINVRLASLKPPVVNLEPKRKSNPRLRSVATDKRFKAPIKNLKENTVRNQLRNKHGASNPRVAVTSKHQVVSKSRRSNKKSIVGIRFRYNQSKLSIVEKRKLNRLIKRINRSRYIGIAGYIDNSSPLPKNKQKLLASKRAISIAKYLKNKGVSAKKLKVGAYGYCCFGSANDATGVNKYYRRAEVYFNHRLLLRDASIKYPGKLVSGR